MIQTTGSWYQVRCEDGVLREARLRGRFKNEDLRFTNPIAVGDEVTLQDADDATGTVISEIGERRNYLVRQSPRKKFHRHIIAANIDQALLMVSVAQPRTSLGFMDRFLVAAGSFHIPVTILINKVDLLKPKEQGVPAQWKALYEPLGYGVHILSVAEGRGLDEAHALLDGKVSLIAGHSGVGKSSLINALAPGLDLRVGDLSAKHEKGKHTTTFATMHELWANSYIIDTPGIKEFGLSQVEPEELSGYFPEMRDRVNDCKYNNCLHRNEPGCAVKKAVADGEIAESRYVNYMQMLDSLEDVNYWERV